MSPLQLADWGVNLGRSLLLTPFALRHGGAPQCTAHAPIDGKPSASRYAVPPLTFWC